MKLLVEKDSERILGAQIVGESGVDKRIDVIATAIAARLKATDLENLDLAYASQFSSAKDPVVMAGFVAANVSRHDVQSVSYAEFKRMADQTPGLQVIDVRTKKEYAEGHIEGAKLIPIDELRDRLTELDPQKAIVVYCKIGLRGYLAARILMQNHFEKVFNLSGGLLIYPEFFTRSGNGTTKTSVQELKHALDKEAVLAIDIRELDEFRLEHLDKTINIPFSRLSRGVSLISKERPLAVICQTGARSMQAIGMLKGEGFLKVSNVEGGLQAWKSAGYPTLKSKGPLPVMRQVQIVAGSLILLSALHSSFHWVGWIVGAGLLYAGWSGNCGMAVVLAKMPWNKFKGGDPNAGAGPEGCCTKGTTTSEEV